MSFIDNIKTNSATIGKIIKESFGPLSALETTNVSTVYRYPLDVGDSRRYPHTIEFQTWIPTQVPISDMGIVQAGQNTGKNLLSGINEIRTTIANKLGMLEEIKITSKKINPESPVAPTVVDMGSEMKINRNQRWNQRMLDWTRRATRSDVIAMYMPSGGWMDRITNSYAQQSMTQALGVAGGVLEVGGSVIKQFNAEGASGALGQAWDMANGPAGMEVVGGIAGNFGLDGGVIRDAGLNALGYALNPQFEMLYSGTDLREFQFDFTMTPRSEKEAEIIRKIIKKFKYHASPAYVGGPGRYIAPPSYFDITFKFNGADSEWLPQISTCVLKQFDVDYTGGLESWATHADGSPIQVKMTMIFAELEMMHKSLRKKGY